MPISWGEKATNIERIGKSQHFLSKFLQRCRTGEITGLGMESHICRNSMPKPAMDRNERNVKIRIGNSTPIRRYLSYS